MKGVILVMMGLLSTSVSAYEKIVPIPIHKISGCPHNYQSSGSYCIPTSGARHAIPKIGNCPPLYNSSGAYCVAAPTAKLTIEKVGGSCPTTFTSSGAYCVGRFPL